MQDGRSDIELLFGSGSAEQAAPQSGPHSTQARNGPDPAAENPQRLQSDTDGIGVPVSPVRRDELASASQQRREAVYNDIDLDSIRASTQQDEVRPCHSTTMCSATCNALHTGSSAPELARNLQYRMS